MKTFNDPQVFARVKRLPPHLSVIMSQLREAARDFGSDLIDFSTAHPEGEVPDPVLEASRRALEDRRAPRDRDSRGGPALRSAAAAWLSRRYGVEVDPEREVVATSGNAEGIGHALLAMLQEGETLLAPDPSAPLHAFGAVLAGGEALPVSVGPGIDFMDSLFAASEKADRRPRGLIVNFPANPTAAVATPELLQKIVRFAEARALFILSDLAYGDLVFDGGRAPSLLQVPGARERTLEFFSLSTSYRLGGLRIGLAAGNHALASALFRVKSYLDPGGLPAVSQAAAVAALTSCDEFPDKVCTSYRQRRDALVRHFGAAGWAVPAPPATPFAFAPIPEPLRHHGSLEFTRRLAREVGVLAAPGIAFGGAGEGHVRLALLEEEERIRIAAERLEPWLKKTSAEPRPSHTPVPRPERA
ncbi:MAG TPA: aminotransferase class I/II-fold pyridoxal phosphate-dependent enzyme [Anaeromyxobacteraceae bacterium]|nr:aminotransferase class I/II-fold pyridoxal phosphate-dependent enzyme [Anaeromyxobacteraceae bacterium]